MTTNREQVVPARARSWSAVPGYVAAALLILATTLWTFWGHSNKSRNGDATIEEMRATGLCRYLSADGLTLMDTPQDSWRMPTTDEIVRSLVQNGQDAGCSWDGNSDWADCRVTPDKETPLWNPGQQAIYYWSADAYDTREAYYVGYNGNGVASQPKAWANPRHGFRCVRAP